MAQASSHNGTSDSAVLFEIGSPHIIKLDRQHIAAWSLVSLIPPKTRFDVSTLPQSERGVHQTVNRFQIGSLFPTC